jgi:hypothetical protein
MGIDDLEDLNEPIKKPKSSNMNLLEDLTRSEEIPTPGKTSLTPKQMMSSEEVRSKRFKDVPMTEYIKNAFLGFAGQGEKSAAGIADLVGAAPKSWLDKIAKQEEWAKQNPGSGWGEAASDIMTSIPLAAAMPELATAGAVGKYIGPLKRTIEQIGQGAIAGGLQGLTTTPGEERTRAGEVGAAGGALGGLVGQLGKGAIHGYSALQKMISPNILDKEYALQKLYHEAVPEISAINPNRSDVIDNLLNVKPIVPGYQPNAAESGRHTGLNALQSFGENANPGQAASVNISNLTSAKKLLQGFSGPQGAIERVDKIKNNVVKPLYEAGEKRQVQVDQQFTDFLSQPNMSESFNAAIKDLRNDGIKVPKQYEADVRRGYSLVNTGRMNMDGSPVIEQAPIYVSGRIIDAMKKKMDTMPKDKTRPAMTSLENISHANTISKFEDWRLPRIPEYAQAQQLTKKLNVPINQMKIVKALENKAYPGLNDFSPDALTQNAGAYTNAIRNFRKISKEATGMKGVRLQPEQRKAVYDVASVLARKQRSLEGTGGDFGFEQPGMAARVPGAVVGQTLNVPGAYQGLASIFGHILNKNKEIKSMLGNSLHDPEMAARILGLPERPSPTTFMQGKIRHIPGIMGYIVGEQFNK